MSLPFQELLDLCCKKIDEAGYNLRSLMKDEEFCLKTEELVNNFMNLIEFDHLNHYKEQDVFQKNQDQDDDEENNDVKNEEQKSREEAESEQTKDDEEEEEFEDNKAEGEEEEREMSDELYFPLPKLSTSDEELKILKCSKIKVAKNVLDLFSY